MEGLLYKNESYNIIGVLFEVYNNLGSGFAEIVYKDAIQYEFQTENIPFQREKEYLINYKGIILPHKFYADFVVHNNIILEIKAVESIHDKHISQCLNYLKVSGCRLAILANFQKDSLDYRRIIL